VIAGFQAVVFMTPTSIRGSSYSACWLPVSVSVEKFG
jgi:hypothetical protein